MASEIIRACGGDTTQLITLNITTITTQLITGNAIIAIQNIVLNSFILFVFYSERCVGSNAHKTIQRLHIAYSHLTFKHCRITAWCLGQAVIEM